MHLVTLHHFAYYVVHIHYFCAGLSVKDNRDYHDYFTVQLEILRLF